MSSSSITRRNFLKAGAAITLIAASGAVWRASEQGVFSAGDGPAYEPWHDWRGNGQPASINLVRSAILAANAHNVQPWLFHVTDDTIFVRANPARNIGEMDSLRREMYISLGCALENLCLAAPANGFDIQMRLMPDAADPAFVAHVALTPGSVKSSDLYEAIPRRHTDRAGYDTARPLTAQVLDGLAGAHTSPVTKLQWFLDPNDRKYIGEQTVLATTAITQDSAMSRSSARWFRSNWAGLQRLRDGITLDAQGMTPLVTVLGKLAPPLSREQADDIWIQSTRDRQTATAGAYGIISIADFPRKDQLLEAGRLWQRLHLTAISQGLAMQPLNQIVERTDREVQQSLTPQFGAELQKLVGEKPWRGVFLFRMGYPVQAALPSPRRSVEQVLI